MLAGFLFYLQLFEASATVTLRFLEGHFFFFFFPLYVSQHVTANLLSCSYKKGFLVQVE